jgi:membrane fusion protein (multidrug efflux system)
MRQNFKGAVLLSLVLCCGLAASCKKERPKPTPTSYETITVAKTDIEIPIKFAARLTGQSDVVITPQVSGQLTQICVSEGQQVKQGQTLFMIDSRNAEMDLKAAQANLEAAQAQESSALLEYNSNKNLYEKKIVSSYMLSTSENNYRKAQASVSQALAAVNNANVRLGFCTITAPVSGLIGEIPVTAGEQVSPGKQLTVLSGNTMLDATFSIPEAVIVNNIKPGSKADDKKAKRQAADIPEVTFILKNGTEYPYKGRVSSLTGVVDANTGTLLCKATFANPDGLPLSGVQGTVVMPYSKKDVIVIPQDAVVRLQSKSIVYKVKPDSTATAVTVTTQDVGNGKDFAILSGLEVGDRIVTIGANNVNEGQRVLFPTQK